MYCSIHKVSAPPDPRQDQSLAAPSDYPGPVRPPSRSARGSLHPLRACARGAGAGSAGTAESVRIAAGRARRSPHRVAATRQRRAPTNRRRIVLGQPCLRRPARCVHGQHTLRIGRAQRDRPHRLRPLGDPEQRRCSSRTSGNVAVGSRSRRPARPGGPRRWTPRRRPTPRARADYLRRKVRASPSGARRGSSARCTQ